MRKAMPPYGPARRDRRPKAPCDAQKAGGSPPKEAKSFKFALGQDKKHVAFWAVT